MVKFGVSDTEMEISDFWFLEKRPLKICIITEIYRHK